MAGLDHDGFGDVATADLPARYLVSNTVTVNATAGRNSAPSVQMVNANTSVRHFLQKRIVAGSDTIIFGMVWRFSQLQAVSQPRIWTLLDGTASQVDLRLNTDGTISAMRGATLLGTSVNALSPNAFFTIEIRVKVGTGTNGTFEVFVDFTKTGWIDLSGINTANTGTTNWDGVQFGHNTSGGVAAVTITLTSTFECWYAHDSTGSLNNAPLLQEFVVSYSNPTAEGHTNLWTPNTGTDNAALVNEATPDGDTTFVESSTAGQDDLYAHQDLAPAGTQIFATKHRLYAKKAAVGGATIAPLVRRGSTDYPLTTKPLTTAYSWVEVSSDVDPSTSAAWVEADFNGAQFGQRKIV